VQRAVLGVEDFGALVDLQRHAHWPAGQQGGKVRLGHGFQPAAHVGMHRGAAAPGHAQVQVDEAVVAAQAGRLAGGTAIGHCEVRRRVGQHADAAGRKHRLAGLVPRGQHGVGQLAAQRGHVRHIVECAGVQDHQVGHDGGGCVVRRRDSSPPM
jgi:hypothetical protein